MDLLDLARRCEEAAGPDRELDALIYAADEGYTVEETNGWLIGHRDGKQIKFGTIDPGKISRNFTSLFPAPAYTSSLDAAMTLVPEGWEVAIYCAPKGAAGVNTNVQMETEEMRQRADFFPVDSIAATPALALTAACLKARAEQVSN